MSVLDYYALLGVPRDADVDAILAAFRARARALGVDDGGRQLQALRQAVHVLTDTARRKNYDATLPAVPRVLNLDQLWQEVSRLYFERSPRFTPLIDALRNSVALTMEGDSLLIVGIEPLHANLLGYLTTTEAHAAVRRILVEVAGRPLDFRVIQSGKVEDWYALRDEEAKLRQKRAPATPAPSPADAPAIEPKADDWEQVMEALPRRWAGAALPQARARFVLDALGVIARAEDAARAAGAADEPLQHRIADALERIGSLTGIDSTVIGLEYVRLRTQTNGGTP